VDHCYDVGPGRRYKYMTEASPIVFNFMRIEDSYIMQEDRAVQPHIEEM
jgi:hypothetical protein